MQKQNSKAKKILYVHANADLIGGTETLIENSLSCHDAFEPHIIFINDGLLPQRIKKAGFKNIAIMNGKRFRYLHRTVPCIIRIMRYIKENKIDIVIGNGLSSWIYAGPAAKLAKVKSVFYWHDIMKTEKGVFSRIISYIGRHIAPDLLLANSLATKKSLEKFYTGARIDVVYYGIDLAMFSPGASRIRAEFNIKTDPIILLASRIQEWKGHEYLIKAIPIILKKHETVCFFIVGDPTFDQDKIYLEKIKKVTHDLGVEKHVFFVGYRDDVAQFFKAADIIVNASIAPEPFGLTIVEGMASGKAVIATDQGGPVEIIKDGFDGLLIPCRNENVLAQAIIRLLDDQSIREAMGRHARETATERFSLPAYIARLEDAINRVAN